MRRQRRIAIRPHIHADGSATKRSPVDGELFRKTGSKVEGRKSYPEANPQLVELACELSKQRPRLSLREISAALASEGFTTPRGVPYSASAVAVRSRAANRTLKPIPSWSSWPASCANSVRDCHCGTYPPHLHPKASPRRAGCPIRLQRWRRCLDVQIGRAHV